MVSVAVAPASVKGESIMRLTLGSPRSVSVGGVVSPEPKLPLPSLTNTAMPSPTDGQVDALVVAESTRGDAAGAGRRELLRMQHERAVRRPRS